jgi:hypothetical protein
MYWIYFLPVLILSVWIALEDIFYRSVRWVLFPLLALSGIFLSRQNSISFVQILKHSCYNISFLIIQFLLLKLYFVLRSRQDSLIIDQKIGLGDILFLLASTFYFSQLNFLFFYMLGLTFSLLIYLFFISKKSSSQSQKTIPLAGLQSIFLVIFICASKACSINIASDDWLLPKLIS